MKSKGFTIIETVVVIVILAILTSLTVSKFKKVKNQVRQTAQQNTVVVTEEDKVKKVIRLACEYGYFEGQKDAVMKDIRIKRDCPYMSIYTDRYCTTFVWDKSPWDLPGDITYKYNPKISLDENIKLLNK